MRSNIQHTPPFPPSSPPKHDPVSPSSYLISPCLACLSVLSQTSVERGKDRLCVLVLSHLTLPPLSTSDQREAYLLSLPCLASSLLSTSDQREARKQWLTYPRSLPCFPLPCFSSALHFRLTRSEGEAACVSFVPALPCLT